MFNMNYPVELMLAFMKMDEAYNSRYDHEYEIAKDWISEEYSKLERQLVEMKAAADELKRENEQLKKDMDHLHRSPADRGYDDAAMYADYLKTESFRKTAKNFGCDRDTVQRRLARAGYIESKRWK